MRTCSSSAGSARTSSRAGLEEVSSRPPHSSSLGWRSWRDLGEEIGGREELEVGLGHAGQVAVAVDEVEKALATLLDRLQGAADVAEALAARPVQPFSIRPSTVASQRGDGGHGVHDLVGQDPDELLPGLDLLLLELAADVLDRDQREVPSPLLERGGVEQELELVVAGLDLDQVAVARLQPQERLAEAGTGLLEVPDVLERRDPEEPLGGVVDELDLAVGLEDDKADPDVLDDGLEIVGLLLLVGPGGAEGLDDPGQRGVELRERAAEPLAPEALGEIVEADGVEEPGQVPVGPVDRPEEPGDLGRGEQARAGRLPRPAWPGRRRRRARRS